MKTTPTLCAALIVAGLAAGCGNNGEIKRLNDEVEKLKAELKTEKPVAKPNESLTRENVAGTYEYVQTKTVIGGKTVIGAELVSRPEGNANISKYIFKENGLCTMVFTDGKQLPDLKWTIVRVNHLEDDGKWTALREEIHVKFQGRTVDEKFVNAFTIVNEPTRGIRAIPGIHLGEGPRPKRPSLLEVIRKKGGYELSANFGFFKKID